MTVTLGSGLSRPPPTPDIKDTFGAMFLGLVFSTALFGLTCLQTYMYIQPHSTENHLWYKMMFCVLWFLDAFHLGLLTHAVYFYLVENYFEPSALEDIVWSFKLQSVAGVIIILTVHGLYCHRIWILSGVKHRLLPAAVIVISVVCIGLTFPLCYYQYHAAQWWELRAVQIQWSAYAMLSSLAFNDVVIAICMCYLLATSRTGFPRTDSRIKFLISYTVSTGMVTSIFSVSSSIAYFTKRSSFIDVALEFIFIKLYVNSFMAMMNARYYQNNNLNASVSGTLARLSAVPRAGTKGPDEDDCGRHIITLGHNGNSLDTGTGTPIQDNYHKRLSIAIGSDELTLEFTGENDLDV